MLLLEAGNKAKSAEAEVLLQQRINTLKDNLKLHSCKLEITLMLSLTLESWTRLYGKWCALRTYVGINEYIEKHNCSVISHNIPYLKNFPLSWQYVKEEGIIYSYVYQ